MHPIWSILISFHNFISSDFTHPIWSYLRSSDVILLFHFILFDASNLILSDTIWSRIMISSDLIWCIQSDLWSCFMISSYLIWCTQSDLIWYHLMLYHDFISSDLTHPIWSSLISSDLVSWFYLIISSDLRAFKGFHSWFLCRRYDHEVSFNHEVSFKSMFMKKKPKLMINVINKQKYTWTG